MKKGKSFDRARRVADSIQQSLATILLREMGDKRFQMVTVTGVTLSRDLSYAKAYASVLSEDADEIKAIIKALNSAAKLIRYHLAKMVDLRVVPEVRFIYDESTAHGFKINQLIKNADSGDAEE